MSDILIENGYEVVTANDGVEGLAETRNQQFDLILADINMPNMTGISMVSKILHLT